MAIQKSKTLPNGAQAETIVSIDSLGRSVEPAVSDSDLAGGVMA